MKSPTKQVHPGFKALATTIAIATLALSAMPSRAADNTTTGTGALPGTTTGTGNTADGYQALGKDTQGSANTAVGAYSLWSNTTGVNNTAAGFQSLYNNLIGGYNTAFGANSLVSNLSDFNTAIGCNALNANSVGSFNTATGFAALIRNIGGSYNSAYGANALANNKSAHNTAIGFSALAANVDGTYNSAFGSNSLLSNVGSSNTALGYAALNKNFNGANNTAIGSQALMLNTAGGFNVAIGDGALQNGTGSGNIGVGEDAGFNLTTGSNNIYLGNRGSGVSFVPTESGIIRIGASGMHTAIYLTGKLYGDGSGLTGLTIPAGSVTSSTTPGGVAITGKSVSGTGLSGASNSGFGVFGQTGTSQFQLTGGNATPAAVKGVVLGSGASYGVYGSSAAGDGMHGESTSSSGVRGISISNDGVYGSSSSKNGVHGWSTGAFGSGVWGDNTGGGSGVLGTSDKTNGIGVYGRGALYAGKFVGDVLVTRSITAQNLNCSGEIRLNDQTLYLRGDTDINHGLTYDLDNNQPDGPFLFGYGGGSLGTNIVDPMGLFGQRLKVRALKWDSTGNVSVLKNLSVATLTIRGGADVAEPFEMEEEELEKGSVVVIDEKHPGRLKRSTRAYDTRVAGIVSGANGINPGIALHQEGVLEGGQNVALSGRVYVQADASNGRIEPGDMLTTSNAPGRAMKATDHDRAQGAILGKAMSSLNESSGMVLVLVTLQ